MAEPVRLPKQPFETDSGVAARARLGLIALSTDVTVEHEFQRVLVQVPGVALNVSRIAMASEVSADTLAAMEAGIAPSAALLPPGERFDAVAYGCSSATSVMGAARVAACVHAAKPGVPVTEPISAVTAALWALGARRVGVLTPYVAEVNARVEASLTNAGFEIAAFGSFEEPHDPTVGVISPGAIAAAAGRVAGAAEMDALFISCTNLRALDLVPPLEDSLGIAVTTSNHAMAWHSLRLAGIGDAPALGKLFSKQAESAFP